MKRAVVTLALVATLAGACGAAAKPTASHSPAAPSASAASGALSCRLPVAGFVVSAPKGQPDNSIGPDGQDNQKGTGGFLDVASGKFTPDSKSDRTYLAAAGKWLPVSLQSVSPDQREYAQGKARQSTPGAAPTTSLYLIQVATGASRQLFVAADGQMVFVVAFTAKGIYVETASSTGPGATELLLIDPATGASHPVAGAQTPPGVTYSVFTAISGDFVWGTQITGTQQQPSYQLVRLSLNDGTSVVWSHSATVPLFVLGFDSNGYPLLSGDNMSTGGLRSLSLLSAPGKSTRVPVNGGVLLWGRGTPVIDAHGTWFGSGDGSIWLYSSSTGLNKVATVPPQAGGSGQPYDQHAWRTVAGPCV
jgi:hypothetical protein